MQLQNPVVEMFAFELPVGQRLISPAGHYVASPDVYQKDVPVSVMSGHRNARQIPCFSVLFRFLMQTPGYTFVNQYMQERENM